jgi:hypothetical protein
VNTHERKLAVAAFREELSRFWPPREDDVTDDDVLGYLAFLEEKMGRSPLHDAAREALWRMWFEREEREP